jgi:hypothetical protein
VPSLLNWLQPARAKWKAGALGTARQKHRRAAPATSSPLNFVQTVA